MLHDQRLITVDQQLWEEVTRRAADSNLTAEAWLKRQLDAAGPGPASCHPGDTDEILLDLALGHFRNLELNGDELRCLAAAMFRTIDSGEPAQVGPVGSLRRHYRFHRRASSLRIGVGEGAISLPLAYAIRLATALHGAEPLSLHTRVAA